LVEGLNHYYDWVQEMHPPKDDGITFTDRDNTW
jgi:hypothetical protein